MPAWGKDGTGGVVAQCQAVKVQQTHVDVVALAKELGVLQGWEVIEATNK